MAQIIVVELPDGARVRDFVPFPGGYEATLTQGCTCPEQRAWPDRLMVSADCPLHRNLKSA